MALETVGEALLSLALVCVPPGFRFLTALCPRCPPSCPCILQASGSDDLQVPGVAPASSLPLPNTCPQAPSPRYSLDGMTSYVQDLWPDFLAFHLSRPAHHRQGVQGSSLSHLPCQGPPSFKLL